MIVKIYFDFKKNKINLIIIGFAICAVSFYVCDRWVYRICAHPSYTTFRFIDIFIDFLSRLKFVRFL